MHGKQCEEINLGLAIQNYGVTVLELFKAIQRHKITGFLQTEYGITDYY
jgi:hypothetical protein